MIPATAWLGLPRSVLNKNHKEIPIKMKGRIGYSGTLYFELSFSGDFIRNIKIPIAAMVINIISMNTT